MRFLVDNSLSWRLAEELREIGHDAIHVIDVGLRDAPDPDIYLRSVGDNRAIITQDVDFGHLLATASDPRPSVILFRLSDGRVQTQVTHLVHFLNKHSVELTPGTIVVLTENNIRIRRF